MLISCLVSSSTIGLCIITVNPYLQKLFKHYHALFQFGYISFSIIVTYLLLLACIKSGTVVVVFFFLLQFNSKHITTYKRSRSSHRPVYCRRHTGDGHLTGNPFFLSESPILLCSCESIALHF